MNWLKEPFDLYSIVVGRITHFESLRHAFLFLNYYYHYYYYHYFYADLFFFIVLDPRNRLNRKGETVRSLEDCRMSII